MLIDEYFGAEKKSWDAKILATDISLKALEEAKKGIYTNKEIAPLPAHWKTNYFKRIDAEFSTVADAVKQEVLFRRFNLMNQRLRSGKNFMSYSAEM
jgi:chemotaxis protein methyltransferase CheR